MTTRQFEVLFERLELVNKQQVEIIDLLKKIETGFNKLPEGSNVTNTLNKILSDIRTDIGSLKDEKRA